MGFATAKSFSQDLAQHGVIIVSGLAQGIDGAAHEGAILSGKTIAVIGTGIDSCFPASHKRLMDTITHHGCVISEFPLKTHGSKTTFPMRNRIIAGLSRGIVVIESQAHGGSLITARLALDYNREVFALPGRINDPASQGTLQLIRDGAVLVRDIDDILSELKWFKSKTSRPQAEKIPLDLSTTESLVLRYVSSQATSLDELALKLDLASGDILSTLSNLELKGLIVSEAGGYFRELSFR
jgi:DNA processing protein